MQITVREIKTLKTGSRKGKNGDDIPWTLYAVVSEDGTEKGTKYTTFDGGVSKLNKGAVIEIGDPIIEGGNVKFKGVERIISNPASTPAPSSPTGAASGTQETRMTNEDWERKDKIKNNSIESQVAFNGIVTLVAACYSTQTFSLPPELEDTYKRALAWADGHFILYNGDKKLKEILSKPPVIQKPVEVPNGEVSEVGYTEEGIEDIFPDTPADVTHESQFKNLGEFLTACMKKNITKSVVMETLEVSEAELQRLNLDEAWELLNDKLRADTSKPKGKTAKK